MKLFSSGMAALSLTLSSWSSQAALIPVDGGRLVDDTANDTLWVSDGNLFKTLADASGDPAAFVRKVIAAVGGVINDTPCEYDTPAYSGHYTLSAADFATGSGHINWYGAQAFIAYLNSIDYLGYSDWRQPATLIPFDAFLTVGTAPGDVPPASGELAELFYTQLGARATPSGAYLATANGYAALFHNLEDSYYYGTEGTADPGNAGLFLGGNSVEHLKIENNKDAAFVWPMRRGQASLPELINGVAKQLSISDEDGRESLHDTQKRLAMGCQDLAKFLKQESQAKDALLDADVKAIGQVMGCR